MSITPDPEKRLLNVLIALARNPHINLGDQIYDVRESEGLGWSGPSVKAWSDAVTAAEEILKEHHVPPWSASASSTRGEQ